MLKIITYILSLLTQNDDIEDEEPETILEEDSNITPEDDSWGQFIIIDN